MGKKTKIEKDIQPGELPAFLRKMADAIEHGASEDDAYLVVIEGFKKLKINIRNEYGHTAVKVTAKAMPAQQSSAEENACAEGSAAQKSDSAKPEYKALKKRMKLSFKTVFKSIHSGVLPPAEAMEEFMDDSRLMVTYEGYGDEYYDEYIAACETFQAAVTAGNLEAAHKACDELNSIVAHCHAQHK